MNVSLLWLRDFLKTDLTATRARELLTERAATVEAVSPVRADLGEIVVARVVSATRLPESDHLWLTKVDAGTGELLDVVCGAAVSAGTAYPFAAVGATLPGGMKIERRKIRGEISNGMLCSARELGLGEDHEGILALETDAKPGTPFLDVATASDFRLTIDVLPNRPDLLSHEGVARELAAALGTAMRDWTPPVKIAGRPKPKSANRKRSAASRLAGRTGGVTVRIEDPSACPRYLAVVIRGVKVGPSPAWLVERLEGAGVRSINNVVDVTNFMLHGFGQPMHAFDLAKLGGEIVVRFAREGERLVTLDGAERTLNRSTLVIAGANGAQAIAGIIGGKGSEVGDATTDILLEVAVFEPRTVRAARRALGISTEASYRFERHVDVERVDERATIAARLLALVAGGEAVAPPADLHSSRSKPGQLPLRLSRAKTVLGAEFKPARAMSLLRQVGFEASEQKRGELRVTVPSWRSDVVAEADLIEEIARLHGYDNFPSELRPFRLTTVPDDPMVAPTRRVRDLLVGLGLLEARPMPFVSQAPDERLRVRNPLAENEAYLRGSIVATLAKRAEYNLALMQRSIRLFEIGTVFAPGEGARPTERTHVGVVLLGYREPPHFTVPVPPAYTLWDAEWFAQVVGETAFGDREVKLCVNDSLGGAEDTARDFSARTGGDIGRVLWWLRVDGEICGTVTQLELDAPAWAAPAYGIEIDLTRAVTQRTTVVRYRALPGTPAVEIDLALIVPDAVSAESVEKTIARSAGELLEQVVLFDEFRGAGIDAGARSLAWRLTFRHPDRTLRDKEVEGRRQHIVRALEGEIGVRQRTS